ncbi:MAG: four helix bundle protein [Adhaeribacter sp.]|nr:four helix bundle protein [Adhaeribacter sp.]
MKENIIQKKSYAFALSIIRLYKILTAEQKEFVLSKQLLRSGTSIGANVEEALAASSKADFINKVNISAKENRETSYCLRSLKNSGYIQDEIFNPLHSECLEMQRISSSIWLTSKTNS